MGHDKEHPIDSATDHTACTDCENLDATTVKHGLMPKADKVKLDGLANPTPDPYAGQESVTFSNGLIIKSGYFARAAASTAMTFGTAFPNALVSVVVSNNMSSGDYYDAIITTRSTTGFTIYCASGGTGYTWIAIGY